MKKMEKIIFFKSKNNFKKLIKNNKFLEHAKVFKNYYGSLKETVIEKLKKEKMLFLILIGKEQDKLKIKN